MWFALKLVSLHYQTQQLLESEWLAEVVICFKISIFALLDTTKEEEEKEEKSCDLL